MNDAEEKGIEDPDRLLGRTLDARFRLEELVGEGGMGRVYRGCQLSVDRAVAVKVLHGELTFDEELRERFFREAEVVAGLNHPNIVGLIDFGRDEETGLLYLVMEFIDGVGLDELAESGRLLPELALRIAHQTCGALVEAHGAGVIHRDLKAENLILNPVSDGTIQTKVVDFGIAYPQDASRKLTMTGRVYGTASYMPPEQARGEQVDERADLFAVGVLLFEMLVGRLPIEGTSSMDVLIRQIRDGPPQISEVVPEGTFPLGVVELVDRLLSVEPAARPSDAAEVRQRLEEIFDREGWKPIRLAHDGANQPGVGLFERWITPAIEPPAGDSHDGDDERGLKETSDATPQRSAQAASGPAGPASASGGTESSPEDDSPGQARMLVALGLLFGLFVLIGLAVGGYFAYHYLRPEVDGLEEIARPAKGGQPIDSREQESSANAAAEATDPVCGEVERTAIPGDWRGEFRPQGDPESDQLLILSASKLNARWISGGGTLFIARSSTSGSSYRIDCARYAGSGEGEECSGTLRRRGPVLTLDFEGTDVCEQRFDGTWIAD